MNEDFIILPNPDFVKRKQIEEKIKTNEGYCINQLMKTEDTQCVCKEFKEQKTGGMCKCGQFYKVLKLPKACLCGDIAFKGSVLRIANKLTLEGYAVLNSLLYFFKDNFNNLSDKEKYLIEVHKTEIAEADIIFVIKPDKEYVSELMQKEIEWATQLGKKIEYIDNKY